jgi:ADP-ribose pyrophosphatase
MSGRRRLLSSPRWATVFHLRGILFGESERWPAAMSCYWIRTETMRDDDLIWKRVAIEPGPALPLFTVRFDEMRHPTGTYTHRCLVLECPDWVNVVACTDSGHVVMVEQFRFGSGELSLEPPAGIVDDGESSLVAAKRELLEESGYGGGRWRYLGSVQPNPAFQSNLCHHWLVEGVSAVAPPTPEPGEALRVRLMRPVELREAFAAGLLKHTLAISALSRRMQLWDLPLTAFAADAESVS